jgi:hypothetical protein
MDIRHSPVRSLRVNDFSEQQQLDMKLNRLECTGKNSASSALPTIEKADGRQQRDLSSGKCLKKIFI